MVARKEYSIQEFYYSYVILVDGKWSKTLRSDYKLSLEKVALYWANEKGLDVNQVLVSEHKSYYTDYRYA